MHTIYLLLWTSSHVSPFNIFSKNDVFAEYKCPFRNCVVTSNRSYFGSNFGRFHAVAFNGRNLGQVDFKFFEKNRKRHQKFIYVMLESSSNFPVFHRRFNRFFNWTATYRLDSDIAFPYINVRDRTGRIVGPRENMKWKKDMDDIDDNDIAKIRKKSRAAAWFVSNCYTKGNREGYVKKLDKELNSYGYYVDIFGKCGPLKRKENDSHKTLEKNYFFYLSFENSLCQDYVTEKVLTAVNHLTVPIVFGGANYSRFLPPGSYLNAQDHSPEELAYIMRSVMWNPLVYHQFFRWRSHYTFEHAVEVCQLCATLNNRAKYRATSIYVNMKNWWNR